MKVTRTQWAAMAGIAIAMGGAQAQTPPVAQPPAQAQARPAAPQPQMQGEPQARVGSIAHILGTASFHDDQQTDWTPAAINYPVTIGDEVWTEPDGRVEIAVAASRLRMQGSTQLRMLAMEERLQRYELAMGRIDVRIASFVPEERFEVVTPRGTVALMEKGDYVIEAGTTDDPTQIGVRTGSAQMLAPNGSTMVVRAGETGLISGSAEAPVFETQRRAAPPLPTEWATRDRQFANVSAPRYSSPHVTGIEELQQYGEWRNEPQHGMVWTPRNVRADWAPYRDGHWRYVAPWGWTWVDDAPWGFAPSHYGRWVRLGNRWAWVPPQADTRPVYAPAVVGFLDNSGLGVAALGAGVALASSVAWFALGPRDVYVPWYSRDRDYIYRVNRSYIRDQREIDRRLDYLERRDGRRDEIEDRRFAAENRRFATAVRADDFVRSRSVSQRALRISPEQFDKASVMPVSAPPVPSARAEDRARDGRALPGRTDARDPRGDRPGEPAAIAGVGTERSAIANVPVLGKPTAPVGAAAPGPQVRRSAVQPGGSRDRDADKPALPQQRTVTAPPGTPRAPGRPDIERGERPGTPPAANVPSREAPDRDRAPGQGAPKPPATPPAANVPGGTPPLPERDRDRDRDRGPPAATPGGATPPTVKPQATPQQPPTRPEPPRVREQAPPQPAPRAREQIQQPEPPKAREPAPQREPPRAREQIQQPEPPKAREPAPQREPPRAREQAPQREPPRAAPEPKAPEPKPPAQAQQPRERPEPRQAPPRDQNGKPEEDRGRKN